MVLPQAQNIDFLRKVHGAVKKMCINPGATQTTFFWHVVLHVPVHSDRQHSKSRERPRSVQCRGLEVLVQEAVVNQKLRAGKSQIIVQLIFLYK